jgi:lipopolysaccharide transport system permease protein
MTAALEPAGRPAGPARARAGRVSLRLITHLVVREQKLRYRRATLGMVWALAQPLLRFAIMAFVFGYLIRLDIPDYPLFLFVGILAWTWFSIGLSSATTSVLDRPELTNRPGLPRWVIPVVAVATALVDMVIALPVLLVFLLFHGGIPATALLLPVVIAIQGLLVVGLGLLACSANVYYRDTRHLVELVLAVGFYATPIVYSVSLAPPEFQRWLELNPMTTVVEAYRSLLIDGTVPLDRAGLMLTVLSVVVLVAGAAVFHRASPNFGDEL